MKAVVKACIRDGLDHERTELLDLITKGITSARFLTHARILSSLSLIFRMTEYYPFFHVARNRSTRIDNNLSSI